jgi:hypothetical protein
MCSQAAGGDMRPLELAVQVVADTSIDAGCGAVNSVCTDIEPGEFRASSVLQGGVIETFANGYVRGLSPPCPSGRRHQIKPRAIFPRRNHLIPLFALSRDTSLSDVSGQRTRVERGTRYT